MKEELGFTDLKQLLISPLKWREERRGVQATKDTKALKLGRAFHTLALKGHKFLEEFAVSHALTRVGKDYKEFECACGSKPVLLQKEVTDLRDWLANATLSPETNELLFSPAIKRENEGIYKIEGESHIWRASPDMLIHNEDGTTTIVDLKTTNAPLHSVRMIANEIFGQYYHMQLAYYGDTLEKLGHKIKEYKIIMIAKARNVPPAILNLDEESIMHGRFMYEQAINVYIDNMPTNFEQSRKSRQYNITLPYWLKNELPRELIEDIVNKKLAGMEEFEDLF